MMLEVFEYEENLGPIAVFSVVREQFGAPLGLLESASVDEKNKFSILAFEPVQKVISSENSFEKIRTALQKCQKFPKNFHFGGGLIGYFNFEIYDEIESRRDVTCNVSTANLNPHAIFYEFSRFFLFDHDEKKIFAIQTTFKDAESFHRSNQEILEKAKASVANFDPLSIEDLGKASADFSDFTYDGTKEEFLQKAAVAKQQILDGEIFQMIISNGFAREVGNREGLDFYRLLREMEPTTHLFFLDFAEEGVVCGASPEILGSKRGSEVLYSPIAGTRFRGKTEAEDEAILQEMCADPKENAEHDMLVDLGRNDLGKICKSGSVQISQEKYAKKFANLMHLITDLSGEIDADKYDAIDFFKAIYPAGTLSGAPKIRAIETIYDLEQFPRNLYGGAVGYFSADGNMEFCIAIRSFFLQDGVAKFRTGAGIVADSIPEHEWLEIHNKAKSLCKMFNTVLKK